MLLSVKKIPFLYILLRRYFVPFFFVIVPLLHVVCRG
jgi:hypothetical protein